MLGDVLCSCLTMQRASFWLPGGHQFLAGRHPLQVSSVPGPVPFFSLNESYKIQRDKKVSGVFP